MLDDDVWTKLSIRMCSFFSKNIYLLFKSPIFSPLVDILENYEKNNFYFYNLVTVLILTLILFLKKNKLKNLRKICFVALFAFSRFIGKNKDFIEALSSYNFFLDSKIVSFLTKWCLMLSLFIWVVVPIKILESITIGIVVYELLTIFGSSKFLTIFSFVGSLCGLMSYFFNIDFFDEAFNFLYFAHGITYCFIILDGVNLLKLDISYIRDLLFNEKFYIVKSITLKTFYLYVCAIYSYLFYKTKKNWIKTVFTVCFIGFNFILNICHLI